MTKINICELKQLREIVQYFVMLHGDMQYRTMLCDLEQRNTKRDCIISNTNEYVLYLNQ